MSGRTSTRVRNTDLLGTGTSQSHSKPRSSNTVSSTAPRKSSAGNTVVSAPAPKVLQTTRKPQLRIERVLGLNIPRPAALALHPQLPLIAYPAGCFTVIYNHKRNKQVGFLIANQNTSLTQSTTQTTNSSASLIKTTSCVSFSPDGEMLAVGE
ncbi:Mitogen-activated protein kinase-binding protein 1, partial [Nowakowskiella sp. JEL0078]